MKSVPIPCADVKKNENFLVGKMQLHFSWTKERLWLVAEVHFHELP